MATQKLTSKDLLRCAQALWWLGWLIFLGAFLAAGVLSVYESYSNPRDTPLLLLISGCFGLAGTQGLSFVLEAWTKRRN